MNITALIQPRAVIASLRASDKKQVLKAMSRRAADITGEADGLIFDVLFARERLGTSGVGTGVAIPFGKLSGLNHLHGLFARLERPIEFEAIDHQPVDLVFLLLAPSSDAGEYLRALARVSRLLRDRSRCEKLRASDGPDALYALLTENIDDECRATLAHDRRRNAAS